jgi:hypothetical protein
MRATLRRRFASNPNPFSNAAAAANINPFSNAALNIPQQHHNVSNPNEHSPVASDSPAAAAYVVWTTRSSDPRIRVSPSSTAGGAAQKPCSASLYAEKVNIIAAFTSRSAANRFTIEVFCKGLPQSQKKGPLHFASCMVRSDLSGYTFLRAKFFESNKYWGVGCCENSIIVGEGDTRHFSPAPPAVPRLKSADIIVLPPSIVAQAQSSQPQQQQVTPMLHAFNRTVSSPGPRQLRCLSQRRRSERDRQQTSPPGAAAATTTTTTTTTTTSTFM